MIRTSWNRWGVHDRPEISDFFTCWDGSAIDFEGQGRDIPSRFRRQADIFIK